MSSESVFDGVARFANGIEMVERSILIGATDRIS